MFLFFLVLVLFSNFLISHDIWIERVGKDFILNYGHHKHGHSKEEKLPYKVENVLEVKCFGKDLKIINSKVLKEYPLKVEGDCACIYILYSSGHWTKTPYGTENVPKNKANMPIDSWLSYESTKWIGSFTKSEPISEKLEIVPLNDLFSLKVGDKMQLKIYFNKKPAPNVPVEYYGKVLGVTDKEGNINIRLKEKGLQLINASITENVKAEDKDKIIYGASLSFEVK